MIYVDDVGIPADVLNQETGQTHSSRWYHLISDQLDPAELHGFATEKLDLRRSYFQPGRRRVTNSTESDPAGDHYDLTEGKRKQAIALGATPVSAVQLGKITMRKRVIHRFGILDISRVVVKLSEQGGLFALGCDQGKWTVSIEWGREADDSPMAAAAAYGVGDTAWAAVAMALQEAGWL